jgi:pimeloyl-ACP methyl ester carboxylesterase
MRPALLDRPVKSGEGVAMGTASSNGIELTYVEDGDAGADPLLLVMGFTAQLTAWPQAFVDELTGRGFRVIRFDNRDCGLSTKLDGVEADPFGVMAGNAEAPYRLTDMAADAIGLLDHLDIDSAHIVGASMGGMIVQTIAIHHPERVRSLCSIMSTTGDPSVGQASPEAMSALLTAPPTSRQEAIERGVAASRVIGSKTHPLPEDEMRERAGAAYDRSFYPEGAVRQMAAIASGPDRTAALGGVQVPTLVIHGLQDPLIQRDGGQATAKAIPGAELLELADMAHDLPPHLYGTLADAIEKNARRADG